MLWHLVVSFSSPKPKQPSIEEAKRTFIAIQRSLDLARTAAGKSDAFLLFNPCTNSYHSTPIDPQADFDLSQYSATTIPSRPVSRFELSFAIMSPINSTGMNRSLLLPSRPSARVYAANAFRMHSMENRTYYLGSSLKPSLRSFHVITLKSCWRPSSSMLPVVLQNSNCAKAR